MTLESKNAKKVLEVREITGNAGNFKVTNSFYHNSKMLLWVLLPKVSLRTQRRLKKVPDVRENPEIR